MYDINKESMMSGHSITKGVRPYKGQYMPLQNPSDPSITSSTKIQYVMTDSEGYGSDNFSGDSIRNQLISSLKFETELHCVILVVSFERFRNGLKGDLNHLLGNIDTLGLAKEHMIVCFTHCEMYTDEVKQKYLKEFRDYYEFKIDESNIILGCFPNISEINSVYAPMMIEDVKKSIMEVRKRLYSKNVAINVAVKINEIESQ